MTIYNSQVIENFFHEKADFFKRLSFENGDVIFWKGAQSIPSMKAVSLLCKNSREEFIPNRSEENFVSFFNKLKPKLEKVEDICELIHWASPYLLSVTTKMMPYLACIADYWHPPVISEEGEFEGYFSNMTKGTVEKITISSDFHLEIEEICKGIKI